MLYPRQFRPLIVSAVAACLLVCGGCGGKVSSPRHTLAGLTDAQLEAKGWGAQFHSAASWEEVWQLLCLRLQKDGLDERRTAELFQRLHLPPSHLPMGLKVKELYTRYYLPKPKPKGPRPKMETALGIPGPWFKGFVTHANAMRCKDFIRQNAHAFALAQKKYQVPPSVGAALLFVETKLGTFMGKHDAFHTLASMSVIRGPESIPEYIDSLPGATQHFPWIRYRMEEKGEWAYKELKALLAYCFANGIDPMAVKGSVYGAIGMCQFMPSNLPRYAVDGDRDGVIDIFKADDAIASLSNYLYRNGWRKEMPLKKQVKVLRSYNAMDIYAHTILALAKTIEQLP